MNYSEFKYSLFWLIWAFKRLSSAVILLLSFFSVSGQQTVDDVPEVDSLSVQAVSQNDSVQNKAVTVYVSEDTFIVNLNEFNGVQIVYQKAEDKTNLRETGHIAEKITNPKPKVVKENRVTHTKPVKRKIVLIPFETNQSLSCGNLKNPACLPVTKVKNSISHVFEITSSAEVFNLRRNLAFYRSAYYNKFFNDLNKRGPPLA